MISRHLDFPKVTIQLLPVRVIFGWNSAEFVKNTGQLKDWFRKMLFEDNKQAFETWNPTEKPRF